MRRIPDMKLRADELDYLSAWAREEKAADPCVLPGHKLQAAHQVKSVTLIRAIKAWARAVGKRDEDIFDLSTRANPPWPWSSPTESRARLEQILSAQQQAEKAV